MSIGSSLSGVTFGGLSSGIDTDSIISRLVQLEQIPINRIQNQAAILQQRSQVYGTFLSKIQSFGQAANSLNSFGAFNPMSTTSSASTVAAVTATPSATEGSYDLKVSKLAANHKLGTTAQASVDAALSQTGTFTINGKAINVESTDSLKSIAVKINDARIGVTASLIDGGTGSAFLTLTANNSGAENKVILADVSGSVLQGLGVLTGATSVANANGTTAQGFKFSSASSNVQSLLGATGLATQTIQINGANVDIDLSVDSLQAISDRINSAAISGVSSSVETVVEGSTTSYRLNVTGASSFTDAGSTLQALGIVQRAAGNQLTAAQDAEFTLDGISLKSNTNTVTTVVPGATITLIKANETTPEQATLTISRDPGQIKTRIRDLVTAFNDAQQFIRDASQFDTETFEAGPLFGDSTAQQFESTAVQQIFQSVPGLSGTYTNLASIGFSLSEEGQLEVDDTQLDKALAEDPEAVRRLFQNVGTSTNQQLTYVTSTAKSKASPSTGYAVNITQLATKSYLSAGTPQTAPSTSVETLTFGGAMFGSQNIEVTLDIGSTLSTTIAKINSDPRLRDFLVASDDGGALKVESKRWGSGGRFTLVSNQTGTGSNSGVGPGGTGTRYDGLDIAGTIGGQAATGFGQFLTGASTNTVAEGLQVQYTGTTTGAVGDMVFTKGQGPLLSELTQTFSDATNGLVASAQKSLDEQVEQMNKQIEDMNKAVQQKTIDLRTKFAAMEQAIASAQQQGQRLSAMTAT